MTLYKCDPGKNKDCAGRLGKYCMREGYCFSTSRREYAEETANGKPIVALEITAPAAYEAKKEKPGKPGGE